MNPNARVAGITATIVTILPALLGFVPPQFALYVAAASGVAAAVAAALPPAKDPNSLYGVVRSVVDVLGHNYGGAVNHAPAAPAA